MINDRELPIFIQEHNLDNALDGDWVNVVLMRRTQMIKRVLYDTARVVEVTQRNQTTFTGVLALKIKHGFVRVAHHRVAADFYVSLNDLNGAKDSDWVVVELKPWHRNQKNPTARVVKVLDENGYHEAQMQQILANYNLASDFPKNVLKEVAQLPKTIGKNTVKSRKDIREILTFTIDPKDAKDFDDALSFEVLPNGNYRVGVHIADVTHYIASGSNLDAEAYERATSVYLVDRVIPMLPEQLSNGLCSLRPQEEKLTFSVFFEINDNARVFNHSFEKTVIFSDERLSYEEAQYAIENSTNTDENLVIPTSVSVNDEKRTITKSVCTAIEKLNFIAKKIREKRLRRGALAFERSEVKFKLDQEKNPIDIYLKTPQDAHKLIEEFMLLANKYVARFIAGKRTKNTKTFVYRVHEEPDMEQLRDLKKLVSTLGYELDLWDRKKIQSSLNKLLSEVQGKPEANMIETLSIRSMSKAAYSTDNVGHYGLAFDHYSHFTSPIRRYPDMMVHRLLWHYLAKGKSRSKKEFENACKHCSEMEIKAIKAERESNKYMQIKYMQQFPNDHFKGMISGVTDWGIFVELEVNKCEGMILLRNLKDDQYIFDPENYRIIGNRSKKTYRLGDCVTVKVKNADLEKKHLDFDLVAK